MVNGLLHVLLHVLLIGLLHVLLTGLLHVLLIGLLHVLLLVLLFVLSMVLLSILLIVLFFALLVVLLILLMMIVFNYISTGLQMIPTHFHLTALLFQQKFKSFKNAKKNAPSPAARGRGFSPSSNDQVLRSLQSKFSTGCPLMIGILPFPRPQK